ncbi:hypothetical protein [Alistipes sp.]|uniref:hypothetical protein n=1 Tax=Alistipes sp. TaxID=1872444 RepID=UPI003AB86EA4
MKRKLTQTDIAGYMPYDLKVQDRDQDIWVLCQLGNADPCMDGDIGLTTDDGGYLQYDYLDDIKPVLRPMSDLYVEITERGYNDGKAFIPIAELANIVEKQESAQWIFEQADKRMYSCEWKDWFLWDHEWKTFIRTGSLISSIVYVIACSYKLYDLLCRLHFDYRGLIDYGLAVSVHDLPTNPYEP